MFQIYQRILRLRFEKVCVGEESKFYPPPLLLLPFLSLLPVECCHTSRCIVRPFTRV